MKWKTHSYKDSIYNMLLELWRNRELTLQLLFRELSARYRQNILGYFWAIVPSAILLATFSYINNNVISGKYSEPIPYVLYSLTGITCWQLFAIGITKTTLCLAKSQALITKIYFCRETLVFAAFGESIFEFLIRLILVVPIFAWYSTIPQWTIVFVPLVLLGLSLLSIGVGFFLTLANGVFRDIANAIPVVLPFIMLLTPVAYPPFSTMPIKLFNYINPVSPFIIAARDLTFYGKISSPISLAVACVISLTVFLLGWKFFRIAIPRIAERV